MNSDKSQPEDERNKKNQPKDGDGPGFEVVDDAWDDAAAAELLADDNPAEVKPNPEEFAEIGQTSPPRTPETSAIDLRTQEMIELPFEMPDDDLLSDTDAPPMFNGPESDHVPDSGQLDLHGSGTSANPSDITRAGPDAIRRPTSPDTDKLTATARRSSPLIPGMVGGLVGVGICAAVWFSGVLNPAPKPQPQVAQQQPPAAATVNPALASSLAMMEASDFDGAASAIQPVNPKIAEALKGLAAKAKSDGERLKKAETDIVALRDEMAKAKPETANIEENARLKEQLTAAQAMAKAAKADAAASEERAIAAANVAKKAEEKAKSYTATLEKMGQDSEAKLALLEQEKKAAEDELNTVRGQMAKMKPAVPTAPAVDPVELAKLKTEYQQIEAKANALNEKLVMANNKLVTASNQLAAATKKLAEAEAKPRVDLPALPSAVYRAHAVADRMFATGLYLYRNNQLYEAEQEFERAIKESDRDARYWYYLGLSRLALGNADQAAKDFREGAEREKRNLPGSATVDRSLERLPMEARQVLAQYRK